jgi:hypothetical protein
MLFPNKKEYGMATVIAKSKDPNAEAQHRAGSLPAHEAATKNEASIPPEEPKDIWGDRFACKVWLVCFVLLALMTAYDFITGLLRGAGSN